MKISDSTPEVAALKGQPLNLPASSSPEVRRRTAAAPGMGAATWRFFTIGLLAFWQGGFTFYAAVVIHIAHRVLGSHVLVGFITQRVTNWLNLIGGVALLILLVNVLVFRRVTPKWLLGTLAATWFVMAVTLIALLLMHPALDRLLDPQLQSINDTVQFRPLHTRYVTIATVQWAAGLLHLWCLMLVGWSADAGRP